ncbi:EAL domain-containing protein [Eubacterium sp. 1001713B170207_170306_E7]|uniref:EAL domain-containing protein n=1 Tax=Eubacterium sp. 1001713B170207_170306_E7 TaxID=2787097 RepID=UPI00189AB3A9|nr:EAL domain-containing protein [Eubacterium sp. 1001713B170207_170306_E7]
MTWHLEFEIYSAVIIGIIMVYYYRGPRVPTWQNRIYGATLVISFAFIATNIAATLLLENLTPDNFGLAVFFNNLYLIFLPSMPMMVLLYVISIIYQEFWHKRALVILVFSMYFVYLLLALSNPLTHFYFSLDLEHGYARGIGNPFSHVITISYILCAAVVAIYNRKKMSHSVFVALCAFLALSLAAILLQFVFTGYILTGVACTCCILLVHLSTQSNSLVSDELTGTFKRQVFLQMIEMHLKEGKRGDVIALALRDFKFANEVFGVKTCDRLLKEVAGFLKELASTGRVYRFDGDVFCLAASGGAASADQTVDIIVERFKKPWHYQGIDYSLSCGLGVVPVGQSGTETADEIVSAIDFAIQESKHRENGVVRGGEIFNEKFKRKNHIRSMLTTALENDGFEVHYQPIYSIPKGRFATCEALVRMRDPEFGLIPPDEFIPMTEENGMIVSIGLIVFEKVCQFVSAHPYTEAGFETIGVNLSVVQCMQESLADDLIAIMERYRLPPQRFKFEITETVAAASMATLKNTMDRLIRYGCAFALDDFGIGYSGVTNMLHLPFKIIKLDKSLTSRLAGESRTKMAVEAIINLIHRMKMRVIAEGVEVAEEVEILREMDCDFIQGYYFSRPLPEAAFTALVKEAAEK